MPPATPTTPVAALSRRATLAGTAGLAATAGVLGAPAAAQAATYRPASWTKTPLPSATARLYGNRFAYGMTPALRAQMAAAGGPEKWFAAQLTPSRIADTFTTSTATWWTSINADYATLRDRDRNGIEPGWEANQNYARWALVRRIYSNRQVLEVMAEFWENHLHVSHDAGGVYTWRTDYGKLLRRHALGRFDEMLVAATTHPAMGIFLDNAISTKRGVNENLGRELLELHTVGRGHYTEDDVKNSARILTGYRVDTWKTWRSYYDTEAHWTGPIKVMGFTHANTSPDGRAATTAYLRYLAHHPATAKRLARKLAVRFVSDTPSEALVAYLAKVYLDNKTAIVPVLRALAGSREFRLSANKKVRTPTDDVVATYRVLRVKMSKPRSGDSGANAILWQTANVGQMPFAWPRPDGMPDNAASWATASRVLASFEMHLSMSGGWWPRAELGYLKPEQWVPVRGMRFDHLVDHLSRVLLARRSDATLLAACCQALGVAPSARIWPSHAVVRWHMPHLLDTVLDSPHHLAR